MEENANDLSLINACQRGNLEVFDQLYRQYVSAVFDFIYYKTWHKETAEDLTSVVFMKALEHINSYDDKKSSFKTWLLRIARNTVIDHWRQRKETVDLEEAFDVPSHNHAETDVDVKMQLEAITKELEDLPEKQREVIVMRVWQQLSYQEIADITGSSEAACKMMFGRSIKLLKDKLPFSALIILLLAYIR